MNALRRLVLLPQAIVVGLTFYEAIVSIAGWPQPVPGRAATPGPRFLILIPAHNEAKVIRRVLEDLNRQCYPAELRRVVVVVDRSSDDTERLAAGLANVWVRTEGEGGKGRALDEYLQASPPLPAEVVVVLDADNRVEEDFLLGLATQFAEGATAVQCFLDVTNPVGSQVATSIALGYHASNRMHHLARERLGLPVELRGTGMAVRAEALAEAGGFGASHTEDKDLTARLLLRGTQVRWAHAVRVRDEKPVRLDTAVRQRMRWKMGRRWVTRTHGAALLKLGIRRRSFGPVDLVVRWVQPNRAALVLAQLCGAVASTRQAAGVLPSGVWLSALALNTGLPAVFLLRGGVPIRLLLRYPLALPVAGWMVVRRTLTSPRQGRSWYHTPHGDSGLGSSTDPHEGR